MGPGAPACHSGFLASRLAQDGPAIATAEIEDWLDSRRQIHRFDIRQVPLSGLKSWQFARDSGNLVHQSGRFFSIEGLRVVTNYPESGELCQPIINQPEIGILGILAKR